MTPLRRHRAWPALALGAVLLLGGCGDDMSELDRPTADETSQEDPTQESPMPQPSTPHSELVQAAIDDLAEREGVDPEQIEVVSVEEVTWNDGSLGCADPDMSYTQALVPGQRITLILDGEEMAYHSGKGEPAFYCPDPTQ